MALSDVETKWYQNSATGHVWNVNVGSAAEERLIADGYHEIDDPTQPKNKNSKPKKDEKEKAPAKETETAKPSEPENDENTGARDEKEKK